jgi:hypothetical protein
VVRRDDHRGGGVVTSLLALVSVVAAAVCSGVVAADAVSGDDGGFALDSTARHRLSLVTVVLAGLGLALTAVPVL